MTKSDPFWWDGGALPIKLAYAPNRKAWKTALKQIGVNPKSEPYPASSGCCNLFDNTKFPELVAIITINAKRGVDADQIAALIAHEAVHMVQYLTRKMYPYDDKARLDQETEAYCVQWATQNVLGAFRRIHHARPLRNNRRG